jgi:SWI/SNF-related matrix-associated actin-dependent regulator 1 of chromatin subfamily A
MYDTINIELMEDKPSDKKFILQEYPTTPFSYQVDGIQYGLNHDKWLLLDAPGLGKTLQLTYLAKELKERHNLKHCLIVCGINTLKTNWKREIEKHSDLTCRILGQRINRKGRLVIDGIQQRIEQLKSPIKEFFVITNIETLRDEKIVKALLKSTPNKFDMIVVDEIHTCKSNTSSQGANLLKLVKSKYRIGATGTLLLNNPLDAYVPLKWIGAEQSTFTDYKNYYCRFGGTMGKEIIGFRNLSTLKNSIEEFSLRRTKDILDLPPKTVINEYVDMADSQQRFYDNLLQGEIEQIDKVRINVANMLAMISRLRQATVLPSILTTDIVPSSKLDRAEDLVEQLVNSGEKVVVFSTFKQPVYELANRLNRYNCVVATGDCKDDAVESAIDQFQNNKDVDVFLGTWSKCGTGITLTAASYMIFLDTPWTDAVWTQAQDRIYRIGSKNPVFIYNLIARGTIDERVLEIVTDKKHIASYVVDDEITDAGIESLRKYIEELVLF